VDFIDQVLGKEGGVDGWATFGDERDDVAPSEGSEQLVEVDAGRVFLQFDDGDATGSEGILPLAGAPGASGNDGLGSVIEDARANGGAAPAVEHHTEGLARTRDATRAGGKRRVVGEDGAAADKDGIDPRAVLMDAFDGGRAGEPAPVPEPAPAAADGSELIPHDGMRRTIARRLVEAKLTIPHFYVSLDCRIDRLVALRAELNAAAPVTRGADGDAPAYRVSVNDMVIKAMAVALQMVPDANVTWTEPGLLRHRHVDVGVAVSIPGGLMTPVVREAEAKTLAAISNEVKDLAGRARSRRLRPEEYAGGTTAVSNLGMYGVREFAAIINPPQATILAVGAGELRPVVENGALALGQVMTVTLSADHRAVDGALAAELAAAFRQAIEQPLRLLV